jgi:hypothetical protein
LIPWWRGWEGLACCSGATASSCCAVGGTPLTGEPAPSPRTPQIRKNNASGWAQLELARKLEPNLSFQFSIFTREQEHKQQAAAGSSGEQVRCAVERAAASRRLAKLLTGLLCACKPRSPPLKP